MTASGKVASIIANDGINMPWGNMATRDDGDSATIFVSNPGFGVGSPDGDPRVVNQQTVVRLNLSIKPGEPPQVTSQTVVASGEQIKARWIDPNKTQMPPGRGDLSASR